MDGPPPTLSSCFFRWGPKVMPAMLDYMLGLCGALGCLAILADITPFWYIFLFYVVVVFPFSFFNFFFISFKVFIYLYFFKGFFFGFLLSYFLSSNFVFFKRSFGFFKKYILMCFVLRETYDPIYFSFQAFFYIFLFIMIFRYPSF